jgi:hypothetical protein
MSGIVGRLARLEAVLAAPADPAAEAELVERLAVEVGVSAAAMRDEVERLRAFRRRHGRWPTDVETAQDLAAALNLPAEAVLDELGNLRRELGRVGGRR